MKNKHVCIHGHFYQPPRENPWLEEVEEEASAYPAHDWNVRVFQECYGPNTASPVLDPRGRILELVDNYRHISFNFGPTLLSWMERHAPEVYGRILAADRASREARSGHGNALAQAYNHMILPLASRRDKVTQVRWGLADFEHRFGRRAEGLWLPETAADDETLEVLAAEGVRFTVLAPSQAARVRPIGRGEDAWTAVDADTVDVTKPYRWFSKRQPGKHVDLFFYNRWLSQAVAFEGLLHDGARFGRRLADPFSADDERQLVHIATDGESYGHHHRFGDMALAFAARALAAVPGVKLTNYGEFLSLVPPKDEAEIRSPSSWSCFHGVGRWSDDCGCRTGGSPEWHQRWRKPLRAALDWLAAEIDLVYESRAKEFFRDPWAARDAYIHRLLGPRAAAAHRFLSEQSGRHLSPGEAAEALRLCEMQRHRLLMFTSCGWFFSEVSGVESVQVLKYAARAIDLAESFGVSLERRFQERLADAPSNDPQYGSAAGAYARLVMPLRSDLRRAAAHFAILDHFEGGQTSENAYAFEVKRHPVRRLETREIGRERSVSLARLELRHFLTLEHKAFTVAVHHRGRLDVECWVRADDAEHSRETIEALASAFERLPDGEFRAEAERRLGPESSSLDAVFTDERRKLIAGLAPGGTPAQQEIVWAWREDIRRLRRDPGHLLEALRHMRDAKEAGLAPDRLVDAALVRRRIAEAFWKLDAEGTPLVSTLEAAVRLAQEAGLHLDLWELRAALARWQASRGDGAPEADSLAALLNFAPAAAAQAATGVFP